MKKHVIALIQNKEHPILQFVKYGACGMAATLVDLAVFYFFALFIFPALGESDVVASLLGDLARITTDQMQIERNFVANSGIAFIGSNLTAYALNAWLVFPSNKTSRHKEMILFFIVSGVSIAIGIFLGWVLVRMTGAASWGYLMKVLSSLMVNYIGRKFFVFRYATKMKEVVYES
jgi:putative flippase GtrA